MMQSSAIIPGDISVMPRTSAPHAGMPVLDDSANRTSWFEFAPASLFYTPVAIWCAWLSLRYFGATLLANCNPALPLSGLVGESKKAVLDQVTGDARMWIAPYVSVIRQSSVEETFTGARAQMDAAGLSYPLVAKPDKGMRGVGVQLVKSDAILKAYIQDFPDGADFMLQELVDELGEAGIFYIREPGEKQGKIISVTLKYFPVVEGDGISTLRDLIHSDPRAGSLSHIYLERHTARLDDIIPLGEPIRLAFTGSHSLGTIFRNGNEHIDEMATISLDQIADSIDGFHVGRFDMRFGDFEALKAGYGYRIVEINGAGAESTHIWDSRTQLVGAYKALFQQFKYLYQIGATNRRLGHKAPSLWAIFKAWRLEKRLTKDYPMTH